MMTMYKKHRDVPDMLKELKERRFFWHLTKDWLLAKSDETKIGKFWDEQGPSLANFDRQNPQQHRPVPMPRAPVPIPSHSRTPLSTLPASASAPVPKVSQSRTPLPTPPAPAPAQRRPPTTLPGPSRRQPTSEPPSRSPSPKYVNRFAPLAPDAGATTYMPEATSDDDGDGSLDEEPAPARKEWVKRKEAVRDVESSIKVRPPPSQIEKRRPAPQRSGQFRTPACKRCAKGRRKCEEQAGVGSACVLCASQKMRCDPQSDEEFLDDEEWVPAKAPIQTKKRTPQAPAQEIEEEEDWDPAPAPTHPRKRPAPAPVTQTKRPAPRVKVAPSQNPVPARRVPHEERKQERKKPAPAPAPAPPPAKKRKVVKTPAIVESSDSGDDDDSGDSRRLPKWFTFEKFETFFGAYFL